MKTEKIEDQMEALKAKFAEEFFLAALRAYWIYGYTRGKFHETPEAQKMYDDFLTEALNIKFSHKKGMNKIDG